QTITTRVVWFAGLLPFVADDVANVIWNHGPESAGYTQHVPTLMLFGPGLVMFTVHYLVLRGFYAPEQTRTVFWIQCIVASTNIAAATVLVSVTSDRWTAPALALA
ncbi:lipid II flippase MurJ, partial [Nocardioides sp. R-C-SC26]|uniref:lipid II flippase MurJ n=1 Tax=Nocardioides sp. R-C-SC26 TaxID=2870414 RepID=UPI0027DF000E